MHQRDESSELQRLQHASWLGQSRACSEKQWGQPLETAHRVGCWGAAAAQLGGSQIGRAVSVTMHLKSFVQHPQLASSPSLPSLPPHPSHPWNPYQSRNEACLETVSLYAGLARPQSGQIPACNPGVSRWQLHGFRHNERLITCLVPVSGQGPMGGRVVGTLAKR